MKKPLSLLLCLAAAIASADVKIATVDMDLVVLSHPKNDENREEVGKLEEQAIADRNQTRGEIEEMAAKLKELAIVAQRPTSSDAERAQARADGEKLREKLRDKVEAARRAEAETAAKISRESLERFKEVKKDIDEKIAALAAEKGLDLVLDSAAMRSGLPLPLVVWSSDALDITDDAIAAVGGDRKAAEEALARGTAHVLRSAAGLEQDAAAAPAAAPAEAPAAR